MSERRIMHGLVIGVIVLSSLGLVSCASGWDGYSRVHDLSARYARNWLAREAEYREELKRLTGWTTARAGPTQASGPPDQPSEKRELVIEGYKGALVTLQAFNEFRKTQTVLSAAETWLKEQIRIRLERIAKFRDGRATRQGIAKKRPIGADREGTDESVRRALAYDVGSLREIGLLAKDLSRFRKKYEVAFRKDRAEQPPPPRPMSSSELQAIISGAIAGARAAHGR